MCKRDIGELVFSGVGDIVLILSMFTFSSPFSGESLPCLSLLSCFPKLANSGLKQEEESDF